MPPAKITDRAAAQLVAHAVVQEAFELAGEDEPDAYLDKARALFAEKVAPELHVVFDEALTEYAL